MITQEQVKDLLPGDVVELTDDNWGGGSIKGPLKVGPNGRLFLQLDSDGGEYLVRTPHGLTSMFADQRHLTVISRVSRPQPVYVNHDRETPVRGDVVRNADNPGDTRVWMHKGGGDYPWFGSRLAGGGTDAWRREGLPDRLLLLVDGNTGKTNVQVVVT